MAMTFSYDRFGPIVKIIGAWTSDGDGNASATTGKVSGWLVKGATNPGATAPTDDYDIAITDADGVNVLSACDDDLQDRDTANSEEVYFLVKDHAGTPLAQSLHPVVNGVLTVAVSNAGASKEGVVTLYLHGIIHEANSQ